MRLLLLLLALASTAQAQGSPSCSVGAPNRGRLERAVELGATPHVVLQPGSHKWGTHELVGLLHRSAARLLDAHPGPRVLIGELSRRTGGRLPPHSSHQSGRDADLGLFLTDEDGAPVEAPRFLRLDAGACARDRDRTYCFDARRTFRLVAAMLEDPSVRVQWVLIAPDLRQLMLAAGRRTPDVPEDLYHRVSAATEPRDGSDSHRSHLHVRILCPDDDRPRCQDHTGAALRARARPARRRARR